MRSQETPQVNGSLWRVVSRLRLANGLLLAGLGIAIISATATPAEAGLAERIRQLIRPDDSLGQAEGTRRGGGTRDICDLRPMESEPSVLSEPEDLDGFFEEPSEEGTTPPTSTPAQDANTPSQLSMVAFVPATTDPGADPAAQEILLEGKTIDEYPQLWLYVPFSSKTDSAVLRLALTNQAGAYLFEPMLFNLPEAPGVVSLQWSEPIAGLEPGELYTWAVALRCNDGSSTRTLQEVSGLISQAESIPPGLQASTDYEVYLEQGIWYDMVTQLATQWEEYPEDWAEFLEYFQIDTVEPSSPQALEPLQAP